MFYSEGDTTFKYASRIGVRQGTFWVVIEEVLWSVRGSYQAIWSSSLTHAKWHSVADQIQWQPSTDQSLYQSVTFLPNSTCYWRLKGFNRTFPTGVACRGCLLLRAPGPVQFWDLHMFYLLRTSLEPVVIFPDYALRTSLCTFSILFDIGQVRYQCHKIV